MRLLATNKAKRMEICKGCEFYDAIKNKCNTCGCYLAVKAAYAGSRCPHNKWVEVDAKAKQVGK